MAQLNHDWLTDGLIDFEYKKYILLSYLKDVKKRFDLTELYPFLSDLVFHFRNLQKIKENKLLMYENFPKTLSKVDFEKLKFSYEKIIKDDEVMKELEEIIHYAIPRIEQNIKLGKEIHEFVESNLDITPVGLVPLYRDEGYILLNQESSRDVKVYRYQLSIFERSEERYRGIATTFLDDDFKDIGRSYETIKIDLVRTFSDLPNPATYVVESRLKFPEIQTVMPIAKRLLVESLVTL